MNKKLDIEHHSYPKPIHDLVSLYENGQLNLSPGFQRESVWTIKDRAKLIDSIIKNYPLPAIFLYRRENNGQIIYDVIDGKQRVESILMFMGIIRGNRYDAKVQLPGEDELVKLNWARLCKLKKQTLITGYKLLTIEVDGDLPDIIDVFVRINSTGKALSTAEKQHAKYYNSNFLKTAAKIAVKFETYFEKSGIISALQITRMKHIELVCEIMISIIEGDVINKKAALNQVMGRNMPQAQINKAKDRTISAINRVKNIFPDISHTRFKQLSDYYILVILFSRYETNGLVLADRKRNKLAWDLLVQFSTGVDAVREKQKKAQGINESEEMFREYLLTVLHNTDEISQRKKRLELINGLLESIFIKKDISRTFSREQRRIIWNTSEDRKCKVCRKKLTWEDFTIDHIDPHSKGGKTALENAALLCRKHNSSKGNRK